MSELVVLLCAVIFVAIYLLPMGIAGFRRHKQMGPICVVNILLGWSLVGWVVALAWALTNDVIHNDTV